MRPATLTEAADRMAAGIKREVALAEFLDAFYLASSPAARLAMLAGEPPPSSDARTDALLAAICEYLAKQFDLPDIPSWVAGAGRILADPWFTTAAGGDGMREYLSTVSPAEFIHHNIFTDPLPLRRARGGNPDHG